MRVYVSCLVRLLILLIFIVLYLYYTSLNESRPSSIRIMYVVRTISKYYSSRLSYLLQTWIKSVTTDVYFITDKPLPHIDPNHFITTQKTCGNTSHTVRSLCCQTSHDFLLYRQHIDEYEWFCHFDDDQYVHTDNLHRYLSTLNHEKAYYIGRNSWKTTFKRKKSPHPRDFWFATLGAGVCFSRRTVDLLEFYTKTVSQFVNGCLKEFYPDDIYLGFVLNNHLNISLTKNIEFHSHLERSLFNDKRDLIENFHRQITFGFPPSQTFFRFLPNLFTNEQDPWKIRTIHCLFYNHFQDCSTRLQKFIFNTK